MLVPGEHADQEIRRELAREPGDGVDLRTLKIAAECVAVEIATTNVNPSEPVACRSRERPRRLGHPQPVVAGIAERAETIFDIFAACIGRSEEAPDAVLFRHIGCYQFKCLERIDKPGSELRIDTLGSEMLGCSNQDFATFVRLN